MVDGHRCVLDGMAVGRRTGRLIINRAKIKQEERLDGKYLIATSDPYLSAEDTALGYKNLLEAERGFRDLALLLIRVAERRAGMTWRRITTELGRVHAVALTGRAGSAVHTTPLTVQAGILRDCQIPAPPAITALDPS